MKNKLIQTLVGCLFLTYTACSPHTDQKTDESGKEGRRIIETGELKAVDVRAFVLPRFGNNWYQMKVIGLLEQGAKVKKGDSIIQLDPTEIKKYIVDAESRLETQKATIAKLIVDLSNRRSEIRANYLNEQSAFDLKKLEVESYKFESEKIRKVKALEFKQAEIRLRQVKRQAELYEIIASNEMKVQRVRERQLLTQLNDARKILPQLTIRTPIDGIFQIGINRRNGQTLKIGDEIYIGNMMGNVPDLKWMKVNTCINERDFLKIKIGLKVDVRLDALPKVVFKGEISSIGKFCHLKDEKSKQKVFDVEVKMLASDERLKPGMTVSCEYIQD